MANACEICGAEYDAIDSTATPKTLVGAGAPGDDELQDANVDDMYYDSSAGVGYLCRRLASGNKTWVKVVGLTADDLDTVLSDKHYVTEVDLEAKNYCTAKGAEAMVANYAPILAQQVLDDGGYMNGKELAELESRVKSAVADQISDATSASLTYAVASGEFLRIADAAGTYVTAETYKAGQADVATKSQVNSWLGSYLSSADAKASYYNRDQIDAFLSAKIGPDDKDFLDLKSGLSSTNEAVVALAETVSGLGSAATKEWVGQQLAPYLTTSAAASMYMTSTDVDQRLYAKTADSVNSSSDADKFVTASVLSEYIQSLTALTVSDSRKFVTTSLLTSHLSSLTAATIIEDADAGKFVTAQLLKSYVGSLGGSSGSSSQSWTFTTPAVVSSKAELTDHAYNSVVVYPSQLTQVDNPSSTSVKLAVLTVVPPASTGAPRDFYVVVVYAAAGYIRLYLDGNSTYPVYTDTSSVYAGYVRIIHLVEFVPGSFSAVSVSAASPATGATGVVIRVS